MLNAATFHFYKRNGNAAFLFCSLLHLSLLNRSHQILIFLSVSFHVRILY